MSAFTPGSVSLRLYPHLELAAPEIVEELRAQASLAAEHGFDGVMTSEHHGGFGGYLPNPLQLAGWLLEAMPRGWAAPCPLLLPLRPAALVAEEAAWLAARFPGRVGLGVAAGALPADFEIMGVPMENLAGRFAEGLDLVTQVLRASPPHALSGDAANARCREHPVPVVSADNSVTAVRRAAAAGAGVIFDSLSAPERCRQLSDAYRDAGGTGGCVLIRRVWVGPPPADLVARQVDVYRSYAPATAQARWDADQLVTGPDPDAVAAQLGRVATAAGADSVNLRVHVPGVSVEAAREQIALLGSCGIRFDVDVHDR